MCTCSHMCPQECRLTGTRTCVEKERRDQFQLTVFYESLVRRKSDWLNTGFLGQTKRRLVILRFRMPFFTQQGTVGRVVSVGGGFRTLRVMCVLYESVSGFLCGKPGQCHSSANSVRMNSKTTQSTGMGKMLIYY